MLKPLQYWQLESVYSGYLLKSLGLELEHQTRGSVRILEHLTYEKQLQRIFGTVKFEAGKTVKNSCVWLSTSWKTLRSFSRGNAKRLL